MAGGRWGGAADCLRAWVHARRLGYRVARGFDSDVMWNRRRDPCRELARIVWRVPQDSRASSIALGALRKAAASPFALREILSWFCYMAKGNHHRPSLHDVAPTPMPSPVTEFILEPVEGGVPRVLAFLEAPELPLPGPGHGQHRDLAEWLVHAAMAEDTTGPDEDFGPLSDLLARTEQPDLLDALLSAFSSGVSDAVHYATRPDEPGKARTYRLWKGTDPTLFTRILLANPHLPWLPPPEDEPPRYIEAPHALLAVLKGRPDLINQVMDVRGPHGVVTSLREGLGMAGPPKFTRACRKALRSLEHPAARDDVCRSALYGDKEMRAIARTAGYLPSDADEVQAAAFLFATGQFKRYDAADPDGSLLRTFCTERRYEHTRWWDAYRNGIDTGAWRSGRPNPFPPPPPRSRTPSGRRSGAVGSWHTGHDGGGYDGGGYDGGGGHGGGYDGGGGFGSFSC